MPLAKRLQNMRIKRVAGVDKGAGVPEGFAVLKSAVSGDAAALAVLETAEDMAKGIDALPEALEKVVAAALVTPSEAKALSTAIGVLLRKSGMGAGTGGSDDDGSGDLGANAKDTAPDMGPKEPDEEDDDDGTSPVRILSDDAGVGKRLQVVKAALDQIAKGVISTDSRNNLGSGDFAFPDQRKEPIHDADHVRAAIARFNQVQGVSEVDKSQAWKRITAAAHRFGVDIGDSPDTSKSKEGSMPMDPEVLKGLPAEVQAHIRSLEETVAKAASTSEPTTDDLLKGASPAVVEMVKAAQATAEAAKKDAADALAKAAHEEDARLTTEHVAKAATHGIHGDEATEFVKQVRAAEVRGDGEAVTYLWKQAERTAVLLEEAGLFKTYGSGAQGGADDPDAQFEVMAKAYAEKHNVGLAKAYDAVAQTPEAAAIYARKEVRSGN